MLEDERLWEKVLDFFFPKTFGDTLIGWSDSPCLPPDRRAAIPYLLASRNMWYR
jgi:hypothetical protein